MEIDARIAQVEAAVGRRLIVRTVRTPEPEFRGWVQVRPSAVIIEYVEERGWDIDFYMACAYERHRTRKELLELLGHVPIPLREVYLESDPPRMFEAIRQTAKPCLVFKILAAGRLCDAPEQVEEAFRSTFAGLKPNDAVIVGMYPQYSDQVGHNAELTRKYSRLSGPSA